METFDKNRVAGLSCENHAVPGAWLATRGAARVCWSSEGGLTEAAFGWRGLAPAAPSRRIIGAVGVRPHPMRGSVSLPFNAFVHVLVVAKLFAQEFSSHVCTCICL